MLRAELASYFPPFWHHSDLKSMALPASSRSGQRQYDALSHIPLYGLKVFSATIPHG